MLASEQFQQLALRFTDPVQAEIIKIADEPRSSGEVPYVERHRAWSNDGSLGFDNDPELAFVGIRALRALAEFCETYQVTRLRESGHSWAQIASWAGVTPQALHKKHAGTGKETANRSRSR